MRVRDVMTKSPACCLPSTTLRDAAVSMRANDCGALPVVNDVRDRIPLGFITDRDLVMRSLAKGHDPSTLVVGDCMTSPVVTVLDDSRVHDCVALLELGRIRRAVVVDQLGAVIGIVAQADIARHVSKREAGGLLRVVSKANTAAFANQETRP
jgi:CBS domain-containing protein